LEILSFLYNITMMVMTDPVKLPDSCIVLDRLTAERHLLTSPTDPFSRSALTLDMLIPEDILRSKIEAWMGSQKRQE
jgi:ubiquitin conjugation factor E4 B